MKRQQSILLAWVFWLLFGGVTGQASWSSALVTVSGGSISVTNLTCTNQVFTAFVAPNFTCATVTAASGGTGQTSYAVGDLLYASAATTLSKLGAGAVGSYLRGAGAATAPLWSTLILPNAATINQVVYASAANTYGASVNFTFDGTNVGIGQASPLSKLHVGNAGADATKFMLVGDTSFAPASGDGAMLNTTGNMAPAAGVNGYMALLGGGTITKAGSGTHADFVGLGVSVPAVGAGAATLTNVSTFKIRGVPTGGTNNYSFWNAATSGARMDHVVANGTVATAMSSLGPTGSNTTIQEWLVVITPTATRYIPMF